MKIGIAENGYPIKRNILNKVQGADYILLRKNNNFFHSLSTLKKLVTRKKLNFEGKYYFWQKPKIDVLHLYNDINYSSQKWVSTFETLVPRFPETKNDHQKAEPFHTKNKKTEKALKNISKEYCLGIIAISNASANITRELLRHYNDLGRKVSSKLKVIHPPQEILVQKPQTIDKNLQELQLIFIGTQFHLKGGVEMFEVLKKLKNKYSFNLTVISSFHTDNYVTKVTEEDTIKTKEILLNESWIKIHEGIPNEKVLELIKQSHIGLLPTWSDTYGFSVLEMQACGVPVITTDIRALPEINNNNCGWVIHLPQNRLKQGLYFNEDQKKNLKITLKNQLEKILIDIFENKEQINYKSKKCLERISNEHDPVKFGDRIMEIYDQKKERR